MNLETAGQRKIALDFQGWQTVKDKDMKENQWSKVCL